MPAPTFTPPFDPAPGAQSKPEIKLWKTDFGDGYNQPTPAGINHMRDVLSLTWELLETSEKSAIVSFLKERGGAEPFYYQMHGEASSILYTCDDYTVTAMEADLWTITATFRQCFSNAA